MDFYVSDGLVAFEPDKGGVPAFCFSIGAMEGIYERSGIRLYNLKDGYPHTINGVEVGDFHEFLDEWLKAGGGQPPNYDDVIQWLGDIDNSTSLDKKNDYNATYVGNSVLVSNGVDNSIDTGYVYNGESIIVVGFSNASNSGLRLMGGFYSSSGRYWFGTDGTEWRIGYGDQTPKFGSVVVGENYTIIRKGADIWVLAFNSNPSENYVLDIIQNQTPTYSVSGATYIGSVSATYTLMKVGEGSYMDISLYYHRIYEESNGALTEGNIITAQAASGNYEYNKVDGTPLFIEGTKDDIWGKSDEQTPYSIQEGYSKMVLGNSIKEAPIATDGTPIYNVGDFDPDGYECIEVVAPVENAGDVHNGSSTTMLQPDKAYAPELWDVPTAVKFNGTDDYLRVPINITSNSIIKMTLKLDSYLDFGKIIGDIAAPYFFFGLRNNGYYIVANTDSAEAVDLQATFDTEVHDWIIDIPSGVVYQDGVDVGSFNVDAFAKTNLYIASQGGVTRFMDLSIMNLSLEDSIDMVNFIPIKSGDIQEGVTALANGMFDRVSKQIFYTEGAGELETYNGLMYDYAGTAIPFTPPRQFNYNGLGYIFADINDTVTKNVVTYTTQQRDDDLIDALKFVKAPMLNFSNSNNSQYIPLI